MYNISKVKDLSPLCERSFSIDKSKQKALNEIKDAGLYHQISEYKSNGAIYITCELFNNNTQLISVGSGKGFEYEQALVGAMFESLEHLFCITPVYNSVLVLNKSILISENLLLAEITTKLILANKHQCLGFYKYTCISSPSKGELHYPCFLVNPWYFPLVDKQVNDQFNYTGITRYSSTNGIAIGMNYDDALLHAINEFIERDALTFFLVNFFYLNADREMCVLINESIPESIRNKIKIAEQFIHSSICIIKLKSQFNIPVFLAYPMDQKYNDLPLFGSGASIYPEIAMYRAVSELVQSMHGVIFDNKKNTLEAKLNNLHACTNNANLICCFKMPLQKYKNIKNQTFILGSEVKMSVKHQIAHVMKNIRNSGHNIYVRTLNETGKSVCLQVVIPGCDRFFNITSGNLVIPTKPTITIARQLYE